MSIVNSCTITNPYGKEDECAQFTIDDFTTAFTFNDIMTPDQDYTFSFWAMSGAEGSVIVGGSSFTTSTEWTKHAITFKAGSADLVMLFGTIDTYYIYHPQLEIGTLATDWTPAPEDVTADIDTKIGETRAEMRILSDSISTLVVDENGMSRMYNDGSGWKFNISDLEQNDRVISEDVEGLKETVDEHGSDISNLNELTSYVAITHKDDKPRLELGKTDSPFKVAITNEEIQFSDGETIPAYINNKRLMIEQAEVRNELYFGDFALKPRESGNVGLVWNGNDNLLVNTHHFTYDSYILMGGSGSAGAPGSSGSSGGDNTAYSAGDTFGFDGWIMYTPEPIEPGEKLTLQACTNAVWNSIHAPGNADYADGLGMWIHWCDSLEQANTSGSYADAQFLAGDDTTSGRYAWTFEVPAGTDSSKPRYAKICLSSYAINTFPDHRVWDIKLELGKHASGWSPHNNDKQDRLYSDI